MGKLNLTHHSVSDWDFSANGSYRTLSTTFYVSPPSSLFIWKYNFPSDPLIVLCRYSQVLNVPQGKMITWQMREAADGYMWTFRNQKPLGSADHNNCYLVEVAANRLYLHRLVAGVFTTIGWVSTVVTPAVFEHWAIEWWNGNNPAGNDALCVNFLKSIGGIWLQQGETLYDTANQFKLSGLNRCGLAVTAAATGVYNDDTEIWIPD